MGTIAIENTEEGVVWWKLFTSGQPKRQGQVPFKDMPLVTHFFQPNPLSYESIWLWTHL